MKNILLGWLASKGIALANDAGDQTVLDAVQRVFVEAQKPIVAIGNEKDAASAKVIALGNELTTSAAKITVLENERAALDTKILNLGNERNIERTGRAGAVIDLAITKGKTHIHEREAKIVTLANSKDFDKDAAAILGSAYKVKTIAGAAAQATPGAQTDAEKRALSNSGTDGEDPRDEYCRAIAENMKADGHNDPVKSHKAVMTKYPTLAEKLKGRDAAPGK